MGILSWLFPPEKETTPPINLDLEWHKIQVEREIRQQKWENEAKQRQIDSDYWWTFVEQQEKDLKNLYDILRNTTKRRTYDLYKDGYTYGLIITPPYYIVDPETAQYADKAIWKKYEEYAERSPMVQYWREQIDRERERIKNIP